MAQTVPVDAEAAARYVLSCQKPNGAFGPYDLDYTDVAWTYPAVYALKLLDVPVPRADSCFKNGQQAWIEKAPWKNGPWYWSFFQKVDLYRLFDQPGPNEPGVAVGKPWKLYYKPRTNYLELRKYPEGEFFDLASLGQLVSSAQTLRSPIANPEVVKAFVTSRQAPGGGFVEGLDSLSQPTNEKAHLVATCEAVMTLTTLGIPVLNLNTLFYPELDYTMNNAYQVYDDGLDGQAGYNAIPGAHFGNSDWMRHFPYKER